MILVQPVLHDHGVFERLHCKTKPTNNDRLIARTTTTTTSTPRPRHGRRAFFENYFSTPFFSGGNSCAGLTLQIRRRRERGVHDLFQFRMIRRPCDVPSEKTIESFFVSFFLTHICRFSPPRQHCLSLAPFVPCSPKEHRATLPCAATIIKINKRPASFKGTAQILLRLFFFAQTINSRRIRKQFDFHRRRR